LRHIGGIERETLTAKSAIPGSDRLYKYYRCQSFIEKTAVDIYGRPRDSNNAKYDCPSCEISYPASRYAPHLEKCLGLGRRIGRRLTSSMSMDRIQSPSRMSEDDEEEFLIQPIEKKKKPKSSKKIKLEKVLFVS
jgi:hypothetical protein